MPTQTLLPPRPAAAHGRSARPVAPRLRGRDAELELLGERLADAAALGRGALVLVEGPPGIGKSRVVDEALAMARRAGVRRLSACAHDLGGGTPLGPLLSAVVGGEERLLDPAPLRDLARMPDGRFWLLEELHGALERAALDGPVLVALDDLQWADPVTSWALRTLIPRVAGLPVVWLLAARSVDAALAEVTLESERLPLAALDADAAAAVATDVLGGAPDEAVLALVARAEGNPFLLVELLRGLVEERRVRSAEGRVSLAGAPVLPARVSESMGARLARLTPAAREAVELASVLGLEFSPTRLAELLDRPAHMLVAPLREALAADLLTEHGDALAFRHDLLREAVYGALPKPVRDALHRHVADTLLAEGGTAAEAARHLLAATLPADRRTVTVLRTAARELAGVSPADAAELLLRAVELAAAHEGVLGPLAAETIPVLLAAGRPGDAVALADRALTGHLVPAEEARVRVALAQVLVLTDVAATAAECARALALDGVEPAVRADLLALQARAQRHTGAPASAAASAAEALTVARAAGRTRAEVCALTEQGVLALDGGRWEDALALLEQAVGAAERGGPDARSLCVPEYWRNAIVALRDGVDAALADATRRGDAARRAGRRWELAVWTMARAGLLLDAGRLADARAEAEALLAMHGESGTGIFGAAMARHLLARIAEHTDGTAPTATAGAGFAAGAIGTGTVAARPDGLPDPAGIPRAVRAALAAGDTAAAEALAERVREVAEANPGVASLDAAAAHAAALVTTDRSSALALLRAAVAAHRGGPRVLALASALEDLGAHTGPAGLTDEAVAALDEALRITTDAGAEHDAARIRRRLRDLGVRRRRSAPRRADAGAGTATGWDALTGSERQVAELIAAGATNREAAEQLFLSPHTVSTHLRHTFAKLGINSRVELARLAPAPAAR